MSPDQARDLFSEALEGDLDEAQKRAFEAALRDDPALAAEYEDFVDTFRIVGRLGEPETVQAPNLLPRIQERIRRRSGGRYYRDRFSRRSGGPGWAMPVVAAVAVILMLGVVWFALSTTILLEDDPGSRAPASDAAP
ncbi:MAG: zf-HC2 domain-containing protein [Sandaracinaceae bacterium]|nr:zf-HC2 domain-containing protein [Sandaracinaceae bacterium]